MAPTSQRMFSAYYRIAAGRVQEPEAIGQVIQQSSLSHFRSCNQQDAAHGLQAGVLGGMVGHDIKCTTS